MCIPIIFIFTTAETGRNFVGKKALVESSPRNPRKQTHYRIGEATLIIASGKVLIFKNIIFKNIILKNILKNIIFKNIMFKNIFKNIYRISFERTVLDTKFRVLHIYLINIYVYIIYNNI